MRALGLIWLICLPNLLLSQDESDPIKQNIIEQRIEVIAEQFEEEDVDFTTLFDDLSRYYDTPLNLNTATEEALTSLFLLTDRQVLELLEYRKKYKRILTLYELPHIFGFDRATVDLILPFVTVDGGAGQETMPLGKRFKYGRSQLFLRYQRVLEEMEGYSDIEDSVLAQNPNKRYLGSPDKLYLRYRFQYSNTLSIGITGEKDPGEQFFSGDQKAGFDFYSGHLFLRDIGPVRKVVVGDFQAQFGQGLAVWSGLAFGKSVIVRNMKKNGVGIKPYTSVDENIFMRGAATTLGLGKVEVTAFGSYKSIDGNMGTVDTASSFEEAFVTSFQETGYHRTPGELEDKHAVNQLVGGGHVAYRTERANIGVSGVYTQYDTPLDRDERPYNQFDFEGDQNYNASIDYNAFAGPFNLFGESAISQSGGMAHLHGMMTELDSRVRFIGLFRHYDRDYHGLMANGFGEGGNTINETGWIMGVEAKLHKYVDVHGYADFYKSRWLGFGRNSPTNGQDYVGQVNVRPGRNSLIYLRYKWEGKASNNDLEQAGVEFPVVEPKQQARLHFDQRLGAIKLRSRVEWTRFEPNDGDVENGYMVYQDVVWKFTKFPMNIAVRYAIFQTDSYDTRIYAYENDVLYAFSIPAYYYRGTRAYLTLKYSPTRKIDIWLRWGQFFYNDRDVISSGLNQINGNTKTEVKAQVRLKF